MQLLRPRRRRGSIGLVLTLGLALGAANASAQLPASPASTQTAQQSAPQPASQQGYAAQAQTQKVQNLLRQVEASYQSGVANYNNSKLDAARNDFDAAVDTMLSSGMDLKNDPQLSEEFERLLERINSLEVVALKQGNGFSPRAEEAPLESATDVTFAPNPELVAKLSSELNTTSDLPLVINDQVAGYIGIFSSSSSFRAHMSASIGRLGKYRTMMQNVLKQEGVPQDLIYLAVAESGFQPQALNTRTGAGGMWQFMTNTAPEYGLTRNGYFDERFDPEKSTRAYARYIKYLHGLFNDWYLAMAAFDWGPLNIQRVVSRTGYADFWEMYRRNALPGETRAYVPKILAAVLMAKNPERYGLNKLPPSPPVIYDTVTVDGAISVNLISELTDSSVSEIVALNPALLRLSTPRDASYDLHLPPGTKEAYLTRLKDIPEEDRATWRFHVAKAGETLDGIAASFHLSTATLASYNEITPNQPLEAGDELVVPISGASSSTGQQRYRVGRGDTLVTVADRFNVSVEQLRTWNPSLGARLTSGRTISVAEPVHLAPSARGRRALHRSAASPHSVQRSASTSRSGHAISASAHKRKR